MLLLLFRCKPLEIGTLGIEPIPRNAAVFNTDAGWNGTFGIDAVFGSDRNNEG